MFLKCRKERERKKEKKLVIFSNRINNMLSNYYTIPGFSMEKTSQEASSLSITATSPFR